MTVTVTRAGVALPGVPVVFHDTAGAVQVTAETNGDGQATAEVAANAQVTIAFLEQRALLTYVGVQPGDTLAVRAPFERDVWVPVPTTPAGGSITVALGNSRCATRLTNGGVTARVTFSAPCLTESTFPILETYFTGDAWYFSYQKGTALAADGGTTTVAAMPSWSPGEPFTLHLKGAAGSSYPATTLGLIAEGQAFAMSSATLVTLDGGSGTATFAVAPGYAEALQPELYRHDVVTGGLSQVTSFAQRIAPGASTATLDVGGGMLPVLLTFTMDTASPARPVATWTAQSPLTSAVGGALELYWDLGRWTFVVPPETLTLTAPALPATLAALEPTAKPAWHSVAFFATDLMTSYAEFRAEASPLGLAATPYPDLNMVAPPLAKNGTIRVTSLFPGG